MISLSTARQLKDAGLAWTPALHDFFAIPDRDLDNQVFVISDIMAYVEVVNNLPVVTFHGAMEWALDFLLTTEVIWLPMEEQLRAALVHLLSTKGDPKLTLEAMPDGYLCRIEHRGERFQFKAAEASEAYAAALLHVLQRAQDKRASS